MKAYVCKVCGYIHFGEEAPERCPQCGVGKEMFEEKIENNGNNEYADEHRIGVAQGLDEEVVKGLIFLSTHSQEAKKLFKSIHIICLSISKTSSLKYFFNLIKLFF